VLLCRVLPETFRESQILGSHGVEDEAVKTCGKLAGKYDSSLKNAVSIFCLENGESMFLRNYDLYLRVYKVSKPRRTSLYKKRFCRCITWYFALTWVTHTYCKFSGTMCSGLGKQTDENWRTRMNSRGLNRPPVMIIKSDGLLRAGHVAQLDKLSCKRLP